MRLTLTDDEVSKILTVLHYSENDYTDLMEKIQEQWQRPIKQSKRDATIKATNTKIKITKDKIQNAVNLMRLEGEKMTPYSVAKKAGVSYNSAKKYSFLFQTV